MKKTITLFYFLVLSFVAANAQVSVFQSGVSRYWLTFMMQNNTPSGDLLYFKSRVQPTVGVNSYDVTIGRYNFANITETMTMTLKGIQGTTSNGTFIASPNGIAVDNQGNIYVSTYSSTKVYRYNAPSQTWGNVSLDPAAIYTLPSSNGNQALAIDGSGNLLIGDGANKVYKILNANLASNVSLTTAFITIPSGTVYDIDFDGPGNIYVSNGASSIFKYLVTGSLSSTISYGVSGSNLFSSAVAANGTIFFSTGNSNTIAKYDPVTSTSSVFAGASGVSGDVIDASTTPPYTNARFRRINNITLGGNGILLAFDESTGKVTRIVPGLIEATLPLFLTNFNVSVATNAATYRWTMASQKDVAKYVLQSSTDGKAFNEITTVLPVQGQLSYSYADNTFRSETYVRLKVIYGNGEEELSDIQFIKNKLEKNQFQASLTTSKLTIKNDIPGNYTLRIIGLDGRVLFNKSQFLEKGSNFVNLSLGVVNASNIYIVNCAGNNQNHSVKTIAN